jgi:hypothetical protein
MANLIVTNTFVAGTDALAAEVNQNFTDVRTFVNTQVVHRDGTNAFSVAPTMPSAAAAVTVAGHVANKAYVDAEKADVLANGKPANTAWGVVGSGADTALRTNRMESADINAAVAVTITAPAGRRYKVSGVVSAAQNTLAGLVRLFLYKNGELLAVIGRASASAGSSVHISGFSWDEPAAGSLTYSLRMSTNAGTVDAQGDGMATRIFVEDVGPAV